MTASGRQDWLAQVRRGLLELCILSLIEREPTYGYEIVEQLAATPQLAAGEGTVYPLLRRLRKDDLLTTEWRESVAGPPRQYYSVTADGTRRLASLRTDWAAIVEAVSLNLKPESDR